MKMKIGAQLYTVRDFYNDLEELNKTLGKLSKIGFEGIQYSPYRDFGAENIRRVADENNLKIILTHVNPKNLLENTDEAINNHKILGAGYVGIGSLPRDVYDNGYAVEKFIEDFKPVVNKIKNAGLKFMYHNHEFEFARHNGKYILDYIIEGFDPEAVGITFDVYWAVYAGCDPAAWLKKLKGRVDTIHFKDLRVKAEKREQFMIDIMDGNLNWPAIFEACDYSGVKWAFIELDNCYERCPFDCLENSLKNLKNAGY